MEFTVRGKCTDIEIVCDNNVSLYFSKFVLSRNSDYFRTMFESQFKEGQTCDKIAVQRPVDIVNSVLSYIIYGKIEFNKDNIDAFCSISSEFLLDNLLEECKSYLVNYPYHRLDPVIVINCVLKYDLKSMVSDLNKGWKHGHIVDNIIASPIFDQINYDFDEIINCPVERLRMTTALIKCNEGYKKWLSDNVGLEEIIKIYSLVQVRGITKALFNYVKACGDGNLVSLFKEYMWKRYEQKYKLVV